LKVIALDPADDRGECFVEVPLFAEAASPSGSAAIVAGATQQPAESLRAFLFGSSRIWTDEHE
jgi:hypothetical protein